ncbi:hypothetical protein C8R43DRAFT_1121880 [Mycena crocata]|nr:hypothetical protein C8R43DRAFT_1121880 [Mycena crocata]
MMISGQLTHQAPVDLTTALASSYCPPKDYAAAFATRQDAYGMPLRLPALMPQGSKGSGGGYGVWSLARTMRQQQNLSPTPSDELPAKKSVSRTYKTHSRMGANESCTPTPPSMISTSSHPSNTSVNSTTGLTASSRPPKKDYDAIYAALHDKYGPLGYGQRPPRRKTVQGSTSSPKSVSPPRASSTAPPLRSSAAQSLVQASASGGEIAGSTSRIQGILKKVKKGLGFIVAVFRRNGKD